MHARDLVATRIRRDVFTATSGGHFRRHVSIVVDIVPQLFLARAVVKNWGLTGSRPQTVRRRSVVRRA